MVLSCVCVCVYVCACVHMCVCTYSYCVHEIVILCHGHALILDDFLELLAGLCHAHFEHTFHYSFEGVSKRL